MKKQFLFWLGWAAVAVAAAAQDRVFVLAPAGEVDPGLVARVRDYLELHSTVAVRVAPAIPLEPGQTLEQVGRAAAMTLEPDAHGIIVLARSTLDQPQGVCLPDIRFGVLNLARLEVGADAVGFERRAGQEGLRVMSMLLGMAPCPFPLCVLVGYDKVEDLDRMSGNFCPPCLERFVRVAREAGLRLIEPPAPDFEESSVAVEPLAAEEPSSAAEEPGLDAAPAAGDISAGAAEEAPAGEPAPAVEPAFPAD